MAAFGNVLEAFWAQVRASGDHPALVLRDDGVWKPLSWKEFGEKVARLTSALRKLDLSPGSKIAIYSDNRPEWLICDYAIMLAGHVSVPLYPNQTESQVRYIVEHSEAKLVFVRGGERLQRVLQIDTLKHIVPFEETPSDQKTVSLQTLLNLGDPDTRVHEEAAGKTQREILATISYTSGTTAHPKGVLLSHKNLMAEIQMLTTRAIRTKDDKVLSYLPLSHMAERLNQLRQSVTGYTIYFGQGLETLGRDIKEVRPTSFIGVPRIYEKFQEAIQAKMKDAPAKKRLLFEMAQKIGREHLQRKMANRRSPLLTIKHRILSRIVGEKVKALLGLDQARNFFGGAAPMGMETLAFFYALGMPIIEVYGLTECTGATHYNLVQNPAFGTVGPVLDGMECQVAIDGEVFLRGDNVFSGYFKDPQATSEAFCGGWFCTGDIGVIDHNGNLKITDRKKSLIVTAAGKNIAPAPIEAKIKQHPFISQAVVIGDRRKHLSALITLVPGRTACEETSAAVSAHLNKVNSALASFETVKKFTLLNKDFSVEEGELTPTLKIKRNFVQEKYKPVIDAMYETNNSEAASRAVNQNRETDLIL